MDADRERDLMARIRNLEAKIADLRAKAAQATNPAHATSFVNLADSLLPFVRESRAELAELSAKATTEPAPRNDEDDKDADADHGASDTIKVKGLTTTGTVLNGTYVVTAKDAAADPDASDTTVEQQP